MILADENIDRSIIEALRTSGFEVYSIKESRPGMTDEMIVDFAKDMPWLILTNDKDFGNWVFAHGRKNISVDLLRYKFSQRLEMIDTVVKLFRAHENSLLKRFTTVTVNKIRTTLLN